MKEIGEDRKERTDRCYRKKGYGDRAIVKCLLAVEDDDQRQLTNSILHTRLRTHLRALVLRLLRLRRRTRFFRHLALIVDKSRDCHTTPSISRL